MKTIFKLFIILLTVHTFAFAIDTHIPASNVGEYTVTIKKLEIYNSTTGKWIILANTPANVDIASAGAGQAVGAMISQDAAMTYGTYTKARVTIGNTFTIKACTATPSCTNNTINNATITNGSMAVDISGDGQHTQHVAVATTDITTLANAKPVTMTIDFTDPAIQSNFPTGAHAFNSGIQMEINFPSPLKITKASTSPNIKISFNVDRIFTFQTLGTDVDGDGNNDDYIIIDFPDLNIELY
jgi:hypothetical protein